MHIIKLKSVEQSRKAHLEYYIIHVYLGDLKKNFIEQKYDLPYHMAQC